MNIFSKYQAILLIAIISTAFIACDEYLDDNPSSPPDNPSGQFDIRIAEDATFGPYLVDAAGRTLYFFANDPDGFSNCNGPCADTWPAFFVSEFEVDETLDETDFDVISREDGSQQIRFNGWPLYLFANDTEIGDINGDGAGRVWFVAKPDYKVMIANQNIEGADVSYLVDRQGNTLYTFDLDEADISNCVDGCAEVWPSFFSPYEAVPSILSTDDFSIISRNVDSEQSTSESETNEEYGYGNSNDSSSENNALQNDQQSTYKSRPLYFFSNDSGRGETSGQGVNNVWFVADDLD